MFLKTPPTTLLQIICKSVLHIQVMDKSVEGTDDSFLRINGLMYVCMFIDYAQRVKVRYILINHRKRKINT